MTLQSGFRLTDNADILNLGSSSQPFSDLFLTGLLNESAQDGLTAHAGGGQANALVLTKEMNRLTTVATSGDSVRLPVAAPGLTIIIENAGANPAQVYGAGTDTINNVATATGVSQMQGSVVFYTSYATGSWYANGLGSGYSGSYATASTVTGLTAKVGGGQAGATLLPAMINNVTTVATAGNSVITPANAVGMNLAVVNNGANSLNLFADTGASMNGTLNGSVAVAVGTVLIVYCVAANTWVSK